MINKGRGDLYVDVQRGRIGHVAKAGIVGQHRMDGTVVLKDGGLANGDLFELEGHFILMID